MTKKEIIKIIKSLPYDKCLLVFESGMPYILNLNGDIHHHCITATPCSTRSWHPSKNECVLYMHDRRDVVHGKYESKELNMKENIHHKAIVVDMTIQGCLLCLN